MASPDPSPIRLTSSDTGKLLFDPWSLVLAGIVAIAGFLLPPDGLGIELCAFKSFLDLPCFGCGLTRSVTCTAHGQLTDALIYNPFGLLVLAGALACLVIRFMPAPGLRQRIATLMLERDRSLNRLLLWILFGFLGFGVIRVVLLVSDLWPGARPW